MSSHNRKWLWLISLTILIVSRCTIPSRPTGQKEIKNNLSVIAVESFLADIAQQVAGDAFVVNTLIPYGLDPHAYEPTPKDLAIIAESDVLIINGGGLESWLLDTLDNVDGQRLVINASSGIPSRTMNHSEIVEYKAENPITDPHFWLDPNLVKQYVVNIRDGFSQADPAREVDYNQNAEEYINELTELDGWIRSEIETIPPSERILVTNHESFGYFADRYGFVIIGTIIPGVSTGASPSAKHLAELIDEIRKLHVKAIFLETGSSPILAEQVAEETGVIVVDDLSSHSSGTSSGNAISYIEMMKHNVNRIVGALQ